MGYLRACRELEGFLGNIQTIIDSVQPSFSNHLCSIHDVEKLDQRVMDIIHAAALKRIADVVPLEGLTSSNRG